MRDTSKQTPPNKPLVITNLQTKINLETLKGRPNDQTADWKLAKQVDIRSSNIKTIMCITVRFLCCHVTVTAWSIHQEKLIHEKY